MFDAAAETVAGYQRSTGVLSLVFAGEGTRTHPVRLSQAGALKVRLPSVHDGGPPLASILNTAGGLTGGDRLEIDVTLRPGAALTVSGQACEKVYKSAGGTALVTTAMTVGADAALDWLMQPAILFDRSSFTRRVAAEVAATGRLLAVEAMVFGRTAMAERMQTGFVSETWRIRRDGVLIHADGFRLEGDIHESLMRASALGGACAMASILYVGGDAAAQRDRMRSILEGIEDCTGAASAWNGLMAARLVAADGYLLTRALARTLTRFRDAPLPRPWTI